MEKLVINKMKNAFGIANLSLNDKEPYFFQDVIYSRNGTFKTSFSKTLYEISKGNISEIQDRISETKADLDIEIIDEFDNKIQDLINKFIVFSRDIYEGDYKRLSDYSKEYELIAIDQKDKDNLDHLLSENLKEPIFELEAMCKKINLDLNKVVETLKPKGNNKVDKLINIFELIAQASDNDTSKINFKKIFQKPYDIIDDEKFKTSVANYIEVYNKRLNEELFDDNFNENNCLDLINSLKKFSFLNETKGRGIIIKGKPYYKIEEIEDIFNKTIEEISTDSQIIEANKVLLKNLGNSKEAKVLKEEIINNPQLVQQLSLGRKGAILSALKKSGIQYDSCIKILNIAKIKLTLLLEKVKEKSSIFDEALKVYINRFHPVFNVEIKNREESLLGLQVPTFVFKHKRNADIEIDEIKLYELLSSGERTSLNIIKFLVEYLANKQNHPFIILDDIVETFDYANRYAFIEYINDLVREKTSIIVLTHNFEFYKTISSRIRNLRKLEAHSDNGKIYISKNSNLNKNIEDILTINSLEQLLFAIPYIREANVILKNDTQMFNSLLHYNRQTKKIKLRQIKDLLGEKAKVKLELNANKGYLETLKEVVKNFKTVDDNNIVKKTILAMYLRIVLEEKIIQEDYSLLDGINDFQLARLQDLYSTRLSNKTNNLIEKIQLSTPEFIHGNVFMYEPLVDIEAKYLMEIKEELDKLDINNVWIHN